jgi:hypothetical protein
MVRKREQKIKEQLGVSIGTARCRLVRLIIFDFIIKTANNKCFKCLSPMTLEDFTIEHKKPWFNQNKASDLYFDLENISFSHAKCNRPDNPNWNNSSKRIDSPEGFSWCNVCKTHKELEHFYTKNKRWNKVEFKCKDCLKNLKRER